MNDIFDEMDVKTPKGKNILKNPIWKDSRTKIDRLKTYIKYFQELTPLYKKVYCIDGYILTISALIQLTKFIFEIEPTVTFIMPGKLNQDSIENFFSKIRASLGNNNHPTIHEFQYCAAKLISMKVLRHKFSSQLTNCEDDDEELLEWEYDPPITEGGTPTKTNLSEIFNEANNEQDDNITDVIEKTRQGNIQRYICGYAIFQKILNQIKCEKCRNVLLKTTLSEKKSEHLLKAKNFTENLNLINPTDSVFDVFEHQFVFYKRAFKRSGHLANVKAIIYEYIYLKTSEVYENWFSVDGDCKEHREKLIDFLITVLLFKNSKWVSQKEINLIYT